MTYVADPVAAYDRVAAFYASLRAARRPYLDAVERLVVSLIPAESRSMLDVGAGDGARAARIFKEAGLSDLVLLEPSREMRRRIAVDAEIWPDRAELMRVPERRFDVITCLWNVLGHIRPQQSRTFALRRLGRLLSPHGRIFLDVHHRYNARSYGLPRTVLRFAQDHAVPAERRGDVTVAWSFAGLQCSTYGHVFTHREMLRLSRAADLHIAARYVVDYRTGELCRSGMQGHLLYVLGAGSSLNGEDR